jgi:hypothetical protein
MKFLRKQKTFHKNHPEKKFFRKNLCENKDFCENEHFCKNFRESKNFCYTKFCKKRANFSLFSLEKRGFRFYPKLTLFINMLKLHKITISESRVAEP